jgi:hypothetical protein
MRKTRPQAETLPAGRTEENGAHHLGEEEPIAGSLMREQPPATEPTSPAQAIPITPPPIAFIVNGSAVILEYAQHQGDYLIPFPDGRVVDAWEQMKQQQRGG